METRPRPGRDRVPQDRRHADAACGHCWARRAGLLPSLGSVGDSDNALAESFNATLKREVLQDNLFWPDELTFRRELFRWLNRYNTRRRHSWCRYQTPNTYENAYAATVPDAA